MKDQEIAENIAEVLLDAKKAKRGAVLLSGKWGVGKTYLYENKIKKILVDKSDQNRIIIYVSLFGIESLSELRSSIISESINVDISLGGIFNYFNYENITEGSKAFLNRFQKIKNLELFNFKVDALKLIKKDIIICFDDLERKSNSLPIKDFLGFVSILKERRNARVLIIGNEDEYISGEGNSLPEQEKSDYKAYLEKVVSYKFYTNPKLSEFCDALVEEYSGNDYFYKYASTIYSLIKKSEIKNLRTVDRIYLNIEVLVSRGILLKTSGIKLLIFYTYSVTEGISFIELMEDLEEYSKARRENPPRNLKPSSLKKVENAVLDGGYMYSHLPELYEFILTGFLNYETLKKSLDPIEDKLSEVQSYIKMINESENTFWFNINELDNYYQKCIELLHNDKIEKNADELIRLADVAFKIEEYSCGSISGLNLNLLKKYIKNRALVGDESISRGSLYAFGLDKKSLELVNEFRKYEEIGRGVKIREKFNQNDFKEILDVFYKNTSLVFTFIKEFSDEELVNLYFKNNKKAYELFLFAADSIGISTDREYFEDRLNSVLKNVVEDERSDLADCYRMKALIEHNGFVEKLNELNVKQVLETIEYEIHRRSVYEK